MWRMLYNQEGIYVIQSWLVYEVIVEIVYLDVCWSFEIKSTWDNYYFLKMNSSNICEFFWRRRKEKYSLNSKSLSNWLKNRLNVASKNWKLVEEGNILQLTLHNFVRKKKVSLKLYHPVYLKIMVLVKESIEIYWTW